MNINDVLYFAPGISFNVVQDEAGLPEQFGKRMEEFYLAPAEHCIKAGHAFAAGLLLVSCIDSLARLMYRRFDRNDVSGRIKDFLKKELSSFGTDNIRKRFSDEIRNGLVHEARLKNGAQFTLDSTVSETVTEKADILLVNPRCLLVEVRASLVTYVTRLKKDEHERHLLFASLMLDLEKDFLTAKQFGS